MKVNRERNIQKEGKRCILGNVEGTKEMMRKSEHLGFVM